MQKEQNQDLIKFKDLDILLIRNIKEISLFNKVFYFLIRLFTNSRYNHAQLVVELDGVKYITESTLNGFVISKTLKTWIEQQKTMHREYKIVRLNPKIGYMRRLNRLLGNKYTLGLKSYLFGQKRLTHTNCFQSIGYIFGIENYHLLTANKLINHE